MTVPELPTGTVTFLFTDLEGSTRLWEEHPDAMQGALARHDEILRDAIAAHNGHIVKTTGDGVHAAFARPLDAVDVAVEAQLALAGIEWETPEPLRVRMGIHTGSADLRDGDYYGSSLNRAARLMSAAHGGQIVVSLATEELVRDDLRDGAGFEDLGEHGLRDLARPERVFQVTHPSLRRDFSRLRSLDAFPGNLPAQVTSFVGRDTDLAAVASALEAARLVTLTGVGGVGKTRLALQAAAEVLPRFNDGAWVCELAAAEDEETMEQVVVAALGVSPRPGISLTASIFDFLRVKRLLLVLDNCEHLLDPAGRLAEGLLRECRSVAVLATSREVLAVSGEHVLGLRSLALPDVTASVETVAASDSVRLFAERASAAKSGFHVDAANAESIAEVCRRLDGIPLALELAAARVAAMSPSEIAGRLDERFRLLRGGRKTALERQQTLRATVDWSYSLLTDTERSVFDRLGVFAGAFNAGAAEAVATGNGVEDWDVLDALASLVAKSMLVADEDVDGNTRYQMLETLRAYARERLDEDGESDWWRRRHAQHYARFAEDAAPALRGPDELAWRRRVRVDLDNLRAAVFWALDASTPEDREAALHIIAYLATEATLDRGAGFDAWAERALPFLDETTPLQRPSVLGAAAFAAYHRGDVELARARAVDALRDGVPSGSPNPSIAYIALAAVESSSGRLTEARAVLDAALVEFEGMDDLYFRANTLAVRAFFNVVGGEIPSAQNDARESLELSQRLGNPTQLAIALSALGTALVDDDMEGSRAALEKGLDLARSGASDVNVAVSSTQLARIRLRGGDFAGALEALAGALDYAHAAGDRPSIVGVVLSTVEILAAVGRFEAAVALHCAVVGGELSTLGQAMAATYSALADLRARAEGALGPGAYEEAEARGEALSYEELVATARAEMAAARAELEASDA
jgi:predicted ATPase/class 3 adenylate cyclase